MSETTFAWGVKHLIEGKWYFLGRYYFGAESHTDVYGGYRTAAFNTRREARENVLKSVNHYIPRKSYRIVRIEIEIKEKSKSRKSKKEFKYIPAISKEDIKKIPKCGKFKTWD